jgi:IMP dehydrogenase
MAEYIWETSRTFNEFLLLPNLTKRSDRIENTDISAPLVRFKRGEEARLKLNFPVVSAIMQAVSGEETAIALARCGGLSFIFHSQPIDRQVAMVRRVKSFKAGFVISDSNVLPTATLLEVEAVTRRSGHSTVAITDDGGPHGRLLGLIARRDFPRDRAALGDIVSRWMTPVERLATGDESLSLEAAAEKIWAEKHDCLPIVDAAGQLQHLVFRKDFEDQNSFPIELQDEKKRLIVGAGINTHDYAERAPALISAGADVLCLDSSDGFTEYQADAIAFIKRECGPEVIIGAGNVVDRVGFRYLADCGADFIKVGIGGGSICITREQKGIGRGQASALIEVVAERDAYFEETGIYIPICCDGGILYDYQITIALAMGADFVMLGRYFARFDQSPGSKVKIGNSYCKEYWAEGSDRAKNWARYEMGGSGSLLFEEGVDGYVPYAGDLYSSVGQTSAKIRSTMCNCGAVTLREFHETARIVNVSQQSFLEGSYTIERKDKESA